MDTKTCTSCGATKPRDDFYARGGRCKPCARVRVSEYQRANAAAISAQKATYYAANADRIKEAVRERYWDDPEKARASRKTTYQRHRDKILTANAARRPRYANMEATYRQRYRAKDPDAYRSRYAELAARRRVRLRNGDCEPVDRGYIIERDNARCHLCGKTCLPNEIHLDHLIPVSKGGSHTAANLAVACAPCNLRRHDGRTPAQLLLIG